MQPDTTNLMPKSGEYFIPTEDVEQVNERKAEEAQVFEALPKIQAVIDHFNIRIAARDSIKSINIDIAENPELHQKTCAVNDMLADALREEKELLESLIEDIK